MAVANGISDDGSTIVGWGINPSGQNEAWVATFELDSEAPSVSGVLADSNPTSVPTAITLTATVTDTATGNSNIVTAEYRVDGGLWSALDVADAVTGGSFDSPLEVVEATIPAFAEAGVHEVCVRGTDEPGNTSDPGTDRETACTLLVIYDPAGAFVIGGGWINSQAGAGSDQRKLSNAARQFCRAQPVLSLRVRL